MTESRLRSPKENEGMSDAGEHDSGSSLRTAFGRRIRTLRHHRLMSQRALAEASDVSLNTIGSIERGLRFPSPEVLEALSTALEVEVRDLFDIGEHSTPVTLEGAARELCRVVEKELLPHIERLTTLASRLCVEMEDHKEVDQDKRTSNVESVERNFPVSAASGY